MKIKYIGSTWGLDHLTLEATLKLIRASGFDGVEMGVPVDPGERMRFRDLLSETGLDLVAQQWTAGFTPAEHARSFEEQYRRSADLRPLLVNSHTGKDHYALGDNVEIFRHALRMERELGVPVAHETHRGRAPFSAVATAALLDALPELRLTADFSHWCCVHESFLEDQEFRIGRAIERTFHIHARVGHPQGPQVPDPRGPEWKAALETHMRWWQQTVDFHIGAGTPSITITPEFGPPPYMMTNPGSRQPLADNWEINKFMKELLSKKLDLHLSAPALRTSN